MDFNLLKMEACLETVRKLSVLEELALPERHMAQDPSPQQHQPEIFPALCEGLDFSPFAWHDRWGAAHESRVFRLVINPPASFRGQPAWLKITTGRENGYTAFNPQFFAYVDGRLVQGMDINHTLLPLAGAAPGLETRVLLHAFAGTEPGLMELHTHLVRFDEQGRDLYFAYLTALQALRLLPRESGAYQEMELALLAVADSMDFTALSRHPKQRAGQFADACRLLQERVYQREWGENPVEVFPIGHTHIDIAWRWTVAQTRQKAQRSFSTAALLMESYPDYRFFSSQPVLYQYVKEDNPELFAKIKDLVARGRWEAEGGMWVEADCNLPSGESLARQIYYGKKFLKDEFDVDSRVLWMPDSFGYSAVIPQLMAMSGLEFFATSKLSWNEFNRVPHDVFRWLGPDGSAVTACMITTPDDTGLPNSPDFSTYNATLQPKNVQGVWERMNAKRLTRAVMMPYGFGDGGGGPTMEMLESARYMGQGLPGLPRLRQGGAAAFFERLRADLLNTRPPVISGELYLEFHRGTYTSVASIKRQNRRAELMMSALELAYALAGTDKRELREGLWKTMAIHQFHDVLPGSAIAEVFADCDHEHEALMNRAEEQIRSCLPETPDGALDTLCLVNPLWKEVPQVLLLEGLDGRVPQIEGRDLPCQRLPDGRTAVLFDSLPAMGMQTFALRADAGHPAQPSPAGDSRTLDTDFFTLTLNEQGEIGSLFDKRANRELVRPGRALNALVLFEDRPAVCDAWNIDINYTEKSWPLREAASIERVEDGPLCRAIRVRRNFRDSSLSQVIRAYAHLPLIEVEYEVDWQERQMLLKADFPFDVHTPQARCGIQYGFQERPTLPANPYDEARFEFPVQRFIDVSEADYGVALFTGDKYGADLLDGSLRLSLLKAPIEPWAEADRGLHRFSIRLFPHRGNAFEADVYTRAACMDRALPLLGAMPAGLRVSLAESLTDGVALEALKPAEDGDGLILRLNETEGRRCLARIRLGRPARSAALCDLMERHLEDLPLADPMMLAVELRPRQILTIRLR